MSSNIIEDDESTNETSQFDKTINQSTIIPEMSNNDCSFESKMTESYDGENTFVNHYKFLSLISNGNIIANISSINRK